MWESSDIIGNVDVFLLYLVPKDSVIRLNDIHCEMSCILYICVATVDKIDTKTVLQAYKCTRFCVHKNWVAFSRKTLTIISLCAVLYYIIIEYTAILLLHNVLQLHSTHCMVVNCILSVYLLVILSTSSS